MSISQLLLVFVGRGRLVLGIVAAVVLAAAVLSAFQQKRYVSTATLLIEPRVLDASSGQMVPTQMLSGYVTTQTAIIRSRKVAEMVVRDLQLTGNPEMQALYQSATGPKGTLSDWIVDHLQKGLRVIPGNGSSVDIAAQASDPALAARIANAFSSAYIQSLVDARAEPARQNARWFEEQSALSRRAIEEAQQRLATWQQDNGIVGDDERADIASSQLEDLARQLVQVRSAAAEQVLKQGQVREMRSSGRSVEYLPEVLASPTVRVLKEDIEKQQQNLALISARMTAEHPRYQQAQAVLAALTLELRREVARAAQAIDNQAAILPRRQAELERAIELQKVKAGAMKAKRERLTVLKGDVSNALKRHEGVVQKYNQLMMENQVSQTNVTTLSSAIAAVRPSRPGLRTSLLLGLGFGTLLGLAAAALMEMRDRRIRSADDIEELGLPLLAVFSERRTGAGALLESIVRPYTGRKEANALIYHG